MTEKLLTGTLSLNTTNNQLLQKMDGWVRVLRPFDSISVISRRWKGEHERLFAMKRRLGSGRISPPAGFEPVTPWSEVGSANRSATRTLPTPKEENIIQRIKCPDKMHPRWHPCKRHSSNAVDAVYYMYTVKNMERDLLAPSVGRSSGD